MTNLLSYWRKLPDELKLLVLSFAVPSGKTLIALDCSHDLQSHLHPQSATKKLFGPHILPLLACSEIAPLVRETFYKQNTMMLYYDFHYQTVYYSSPLNAPLIRHLRIQIVATRLKDLEILPGLSSARCRFSNLASVEILVCPMSHGELLHLRQEVLDFLGALEVVDVPTRRLKVEYAHVFADDQGQHHASPADVLLDKLTIQAGSSSERWERYWFKGGGCYEKHAVESWDGEIPVQAVHRYTVTEVCVGRK